MCGEIMITGWPLWLFVGAYLFALLVAVVVSVAR
jgi:hypothetical protein